MRRRAMPLDDQTWLAPRRRAMPLDDQTWLAPRCPPPSRPSYPNCILITRPFLTSNNTNKDSSVLPYRPVVRDSRFPPILVASRQQAACIRQELPPLPPPPPLLPLPPLPPLPWHCFALPFMDPGPSAPSRAAHHECRNNKEELIRAAALFQNQRYCVL